jgi:hypothetical protein
MVVILPQSLGHAMARPDSLEQTKPWEAKGISRRTWFRRRARGNRNNGRLEGLPQRPKSVPEIDVTSEFPGACPCADVLSSARRDNRRRMRTCDGPDRRDPACPVACGGTGGGPKRERSREYRQKGLTGRGGEVGLPGFGRLGGCSSFEDKAVSVTRLKPVSEPVGQRQVACEFRDRHARRQQHTRAYNLHLIDLVRAYVFGSRASLAPTSARRRSSTGCCSAMAFQRWRSGDLGMATTARRS